MGLPVKAFAHKAARRRKRMTNENLILNKEKDWVQSTKTANIPFAWFPFLSKKQTHTILHTFAHHSSNYINPSIKSNQIAPKITCLLYEKLICLLTSPIPAFPKVDMCKSSFIKTHWYAKHRQTLLSITLIKLDSPSIKARPKSSLST